ncbi:hypothetical protein Tco_0935376 [Tanacetum coccineum]
MTCLFKIFQLLKSEMLTRMYTRRSLRNNILSCSVDYSRVNVNCTSCNNLVGDTHFARGLMRIIQMIIMRERKRSIKALLRNPIQSLQRMQMKRTNLKAQGILKSYNLVIWKMEKLLQVMRMDKNYQAEPTPISCVIEDETNIFCKTELKNVEFAKIEHNKEKALRKQIRLGTERLYMMEQLHNVMTAPPDWVNQDPSEYNFNIYLDNVHMYPARPFLLLVYGPPNRLIDGIEDYRNYDLMFLQKGSTIREELEPSLNRAMAIDYNEDDMEELFKDGFIFWLFARYSYGEKEEKLETLTPTKIRSALIPTNLLMSIFI